MKLAGTLLVYMGNKFDYCYKEAIQCLLECTDHVFVLAGGDDDTFNDVIEMWGQSDKMTVAELTETRWNSINGKEKLSEFTNDVIGMAESAGYEYQFNLQADEIIHEKSYDAIHKAVETGQEGFMCNRINLWQNPYLQLKTTLPANRMPCSYNIVRLAKTKYRSIDDAESLGVDNVNCDFLEQIRIYHMGFVRKRDVMKEKIIHIQEQIFLVDHDKKLDGSDIFIPQRWFDPQTDLKPIDEPLPKIIQNWAKERYYKD